MKQEFSSRPCVIRSSVKRGLLERMEEALSREFQVSANCMRWGVFKTSLNS